MWLVSYPLIGTTQKNATPALRNVSVMKTQNLLSARTVAARWDCHRSTVLRICRRFGYSGMKFGSDSASTRRFEKTEIERIEKAVGIVNHPAHEQDDNPPAVQARNWGSENIDQSEE